MRKTNGSSGQNIKNPDLSVVIGIRNWGLDRLEVAVRSHLAAAVDNIEIVISDYGSKNHQDVSEIAKRYGCKYVFTSADNWSRSAALNAGIKAASSDYILTTDADIIFSPRSHEILLHNLKLMPDSVQIIQCRDLPEGFGAENLSAFDWDQFFKVSSIRPRWGMGGSATFTKALFSRIHGFDERMTVWGGEDNDFVQRARRSGSLLNWIEDPEAQIYHIWHPPDSRGSTKAEAKIVEKNKQILKEDPTIVRNLSRSYRGSHGFVPTVSVVIATKNRPDLLRESVSSCLKQTFQDFEIVVVDDGSSDEARPILDDFGDDRIRLLRLEESRGVAFARNYANAMARGEFIAIHDDDDLMLPQRLEHQLGAIADDSAGSFGGWIDFNDETGALTPNPGRVNFDRPSLMMRRTLVHASVLIRRQALKYYKYNENFSANSDYHLLNRIARGGIRLSHCGHYVILRRLHSHNLTGTHGSTQKSTAGISKAMALGTISAEIAQQYRKTANANPQADLPLHAVVEAAQHLPSRLLSKNLRIEFKKPLTEPGELTGLAAAISASQGINLEFDAGTSKGVTAITAVADTEGARTRLTSILSSLGDVEHISEPMLPLAHLDLSTIATETEANAIAERDALNIGSDLEGSLRVLGKHCRLCFLSTDGTSGYRLGLPPLKPPVEALLRAKLSRFLTGSRVEVEV